MKQRTCTELVFVQSSHTATSRPSGAGDNADFSSCSFAPKSAVFPMSWSSVHPQSTAAVSGIYHPYIHQPQLAGTENRYVRSWIDPISNSVSFSGFHPSSRHYGTKPESLPSKRNECAAFEAQTPVVPDYICGAVLENKDKATKEPIASEFRATVSPKKRSSNNLTQATQLLIGFMHVPQERSDVLTQNIRH
ncbi:hypothetical protein SKAU_G00235020 [Synaphobranchus kaupii]|uniref:Hox9 N-terminal activation domain-containing protein n=1 Tax=Synaphobranchus kaupii TaxID=118154 RepID=A0A9Q1F6U1_SYNKA|nr:hypothetical protein SKAU_G00235020 [Synaphobranchus kaupii]